ncbi:hypothetical protein QBC33DRAFT_564232 [Phialemonium atrogriseum]|uniref:Uncharacterized protein n=1 Tax=Phialemonium atrogriseum TaxID=1093897 RepID=A0AAJ0FG32_9PEZI|nr:uncharacterized protein QBC33DRAFT_564232 [Phialemonium atrogriseum]KAK1761983.1 hypothetical protein QBC33DRAFT_564232 [Phialemonium atrogriseum]
MQSFNQAKPVAAPIHVLHTILTKLDSSRRVGNKWHTLGGVPHNPWFILVQATTLAGQVIIIFLGGDAFQTSTVPAGEQFDLVEAIEASRHDAAECPRAPGLEVHPNTMKVDPVLDLARTEGRAPEPGPGVAQTSVNNVLLGQPLAACVKKVLTTPRNIIPG